MLNHSTSVSTPSSPEDALSKPGSTLNLLQQLIDVASISPAAIARQAELSTSELHTLRNLCTGPQGPAELARRIGITTAASTGVVDRLVARGYVTRCPHPTDGRRTVVGLTAAGTTEILGHLRPMLDQLNQLDSELSDHERLIIENFLKRAITAVKAIL